MVENMNDKNEHLLLEGEPKELLSIRHISDCENFGHKVFTDENSYKDHEIEDLWNKYVKFFGLLPRQRRELLVARRTEFELGKTNTHP